MKRTSLLSLETVNDRHSLLKHAQSEFRWHIPGVVLEDQFLVPDGRILVITSNNCPYEESLHLLLLRTGNEDFERVDLEMDYAPGMYTAGKIVSESTFEFQFFNKEEFRVEISSSPQFLFGQILSGNGIKYRSPLKRKTLIVSQVTTV